MNYLNESYIENQSGRHAKSHGFLFIKLSPHFFKGVPDRMVLGPNKLIFFAEFKSPKNKDNKKHLNRQTYVHKLIRKFGFSVYKVDSIDKFISVLNKEVKKCLSSNL